MSYNQTILIYVYRRLTFSSFEVSVDRYSNDIAQSGSSWYNGLTMSSYVTRSGSLKVENAT